jgi:hypothetical protein
MDLICWIAMDCLCLMRFVLNDSINKKYINNHKHTPCLSILMPDCMSRQKILYTILLSSPRSLLALLAQTYLQYTFSWYTGRSWEVVLLFSISVALLSVHVYTLFLWFDLIHIYRIYPDYPRLIPCTVIYLKDPKGNDLKQDCKSRWTWMNMNEHGVAEVNPKQYLSERTQSTPYMCMIGLSMSFQ